MISAAFAADLRHRLPVAVVAAVVVAEAGIAVAVVLAVAGRSAPSVVAAVAVAVPGRSALSVVEAVAAVAAVILARFAPVVVDPVVVLPRMWGKILPNPVSERHNFHKLPWLSPPFERYT